MVSRNATILSENSSDFIPFYFSDVILCDETDRTTAELKVGLHMPVGPVVTVKWGWILCSVQFFSRLVLSTSARFL